MTDTNNNTAERERLANRLDFYAGDRVENIEYEKTLKRAAALLRQSPAPEPVDPAQELVESWYDEIPEVLDQCQIDSLIYRVRQALSEAEARMQAAVEAEREQCQQVHYDHRGDVLYIALKDIPHMETVYTEQPMIVLVGRDPTSDDAPVRLMVMDWAGQVKDVADTAKHVAEAIGKGYYSAAIRERGASGGKQDG